MHASVCPRAPKTRFQQPKNIMRRRGHLLKKHLNWKTEISVCVIITSAFAKNAHAHEAKFKCSIPFLGEDQNVCRSGPFCQSGRPNDPEGC